jgi:hypothetical protein
MESSFWAIAEIPVTVNSKAMQNRLIGNILTLKLTKLFDEWPVAAKRPVKFALPSTYQLRLNLRL